MFERYDENARRSLFFARYEASQLGSLAIEPEHLLLGLLRLDENAASPFLARLPDIRTPLIEAARDKKKISTSVEIPFSKPAKRALEAAVQEADGLQHTHIGPEHLFLALLADRTTIAGDLLARNGLEADAVRKEIKNRPAAERPGAVLFAGYTPPGERRQQALHQIESAAAFMRSFGEQHAQTDEVRRLVDQICRDIEALKSHLPEA